MHSETYGRLRLDKHHTYWSIITKDKLEDSFDTLPRKVLHVGSPKYVQGIWNRLIKNPAWQKDAVKWR